MKTQRLIFFLGFLFCLSTANAQESTIIGIKVGGNTSIMGVSYDDDFTSSGLTLVSKQGFLFGLYTQRYITSTIGAKLEINYIQKGAREVGRDNLGDFYSSEYISIPIFLMYRKRNFETELGFGTSVLLGNKSRLSMIGRRYGKVIKKNKQDLLIHTGFHWHAKKMSVGIRYSQGLINAISIAETDFFGRDVLNHPRFYNSSLQLEVAFRLK